MATHSGRKPLANFFVKKAMQIDLIIKIVLVFCFSTVVSTGTIVLTYFLRHRSILLYQLEQDGTLSKENIFLVLLPSIIISIVVNVILSFLIGLWASRKYAVPVYKLEQWAQLVRKGDIAAPLRFREQRQMQDLQEQIDRLGQTLCENFSLVREVVTDLPEEGPKAAQVRKLKDTVSAMVLSGSRNDELTG